MGGSVGKALDPTGGNFLGTGGTTSKILGGAFSPISSIFPGGQFGRSNPKPLSTYNDLPFGQQYYPGVQNSSTSNSDQALLNQFQQMYETGQGYGDVNDKPAVAYKAFVETNGRPPTFGELGGALNTATTGLDSYALSGARPLLEAEGDKQYGQINDLSQKQYGQTQDFINQDASSRETARANLAENLTGHARDVFARTLPNIAENSQASHLYDSTGYGQEVARQQAALGQDIASQMGQLGVQDIYGQSAQREAALKGLLGSQRSALDQQQSFQKGGLQRFTGLQDFANQAKLAKEIGASSVPQVGKGGGTGALRGGALGAASGAPFGPWGAGIGGALGAITGGVSPSSGGK